MGYCPQSRLVSDLSPSYVFLEINVNQKIQDTLLALKVVMEQTV